MKNKIIQWIVWKLPPKILLWAVIRGFADATTGKWGHRHVDSVGYSGIYEAIVEKYNVNEK